MPKWFPHNLAETVVFVPVRVLFLIIVALLARTVLHRLIARTVRPGDRPPAPLQAPGGSGAGRRREPAG